MSDDILVLAFAVALFAVGTVAGFLGAMTGIGGAAVIMPALSIFLGVPVQFAVGTSLVATIATSSSAASKYVQDRIADIRIGMSLEIGTTAGAIIGALLAALVYELGFSQIIFVVFGALLLVSVYVSFTRRDVHRIDIASDNTTKRFRMRGSYYDSAERKRVNYTGVRWFTGELVMLCAGLFSGLLGIGSGALKVLGMDSAMHLPIKVSTATSDFMIGVTAVTGSGIYWALGYVNPRLVAPVVLGVVLGAYIGSRVMEKQTNRRIAQVFMIVLIAVAIDTILKGVGVL